MSPICVTFVVSLLVLGDLTAADLYCKDENGKNVDWFFVYKLPKIKQRKNSHFADGLKYAYISGPPINGKGTITGWKLSQKQVGDVNSIFGKTLAPVYKKPDWYTTVQYNDDPPGGEGNTYWAHAKGTLAMDSHTGFWITHSIPNFPPAFNTRNYEYPASAANNGQTALCISFKTSEMGNTILNHLLTLRPNIYYNSQRDNVLKDDSVLTNLIEKKASKDAFAQYTIRSVNGIVFNSFSKSTKAGGDLYDQYMAPALQSNLLVSTWRRGSGGTLPSTCKAKYTTENIDALELDFEEGNHMSSDEWSYTQDHAKWAITDSETSPFTCIGDINRMESQFKRGGGSVCLHNYDIWYYFRKSIRAREQCKNNKKKPTRLPIIPYPFPLTAINFA